MICRICRKKILNKQPVSNLTLDVNQVYSSPGIADVTQNVFGFCESCKHGQLENVMSPQKYYSYSLLKIDSKALPTGENAPLRLDYYRSVIERLSMICAVRDKFLDIGCGHGTIMELAADFFRDVKGVDPSEEETAIVRAKGFAVENAFFSASWQETGFSAFTMTQVMEHLPNPREIAETAYRILVPGGAGYIDVPNGYRIYQEGRYFDLFTEHINYWSMNGLIKIFAESGFDIDFAGETQGGNHIAIYVKKPGSHITFQEKIERERKMVMGVFEKYHCVGVWGAGVKGREFIKRSLSSYSLAHLFDNNRALEGKYVPGCECQIEKPNEAAICACDVILLTAIEYQDEITHELLEKYHFKGSVIGIND